jgi:hypothetical protein
VKKQVLLFWISRPPQKLLVRASDNIHILFAFLIQSRQSFARRSSCSGVIGGAHGTLGFVACWGLEPKG